ncbi:interleukin-1 receptor type 1-like [Osmerus eperlanus]|uniref:interleukin-1 receptor type 1-like n=1 Tax=Osmerus eperlanus TaxID=29151 RepID=UPI002E111AC3
MDSFYLLLLLLFLEVSGNMQPKILTPRNGEVIEVTLGSHTEIVCNSSIYKDLDSEVYWMKTMNTTMTFLDENEMLPVFYKEQNGSATLTIREVSEEALVFNYTCILTSTSGMDLASISLILKAPPPSYILVVGLPVLLVVVVVMSIVIYVTLRVDIVLFVRDRLGFHGRTSDGKSYDAYIMPFEGPGGVGLTAQDRRMLEAVLEEQLPLIQPLSLPPRCPAWTSCSQGSSGLHKTKSQAGSGPLLSGPRTEPGPGPQPGQQQ